MANIKFQLDYIVKDGITEEEAIENVKEMILEDGISSAINEDNLVEFNKKKSIKDYIPNLDKLYEVTRDWIKNHQGEKDYIETENPDGKCDNIYAISYDEHENRGVELRIIAIRVKHDNIEVALEWDYVYLPTRSSYEDYLEDDDNWYVVRGGDYVFYIETIFSIAESVEQYVEE